MAASEELDRAINEAAFSCGYQSLKNELSFKEEMFLCLSPRDLAKVLVLFAFQVLLIFC
jgi:hypothetical protein